MKHIENYYDGYDGLKIYYQAWLPDNEPKAIVQVFHGFGEHSGRYGNVVNRIVDKGYAVYINDHRGHGKSDGKRNHAKTLDEFVEDERKLTEIIKKNHPNNLPIFILGHSMGSLVGKLYSLKYQEEVKGLILSGTGIANFRVPAIMKYSALILGKLFPKFSAPSLLDPNELSSDQQVVNDYINDPLVHYKTISAALGRCFITYYDKVKDQLPSIKVPILIQSGEKDKLMLGREKLFDELGSEDKTMKIYPGCKHEVYNETKEQKESAINDLLDWLEKHLN